MNPIKIIFSAALLFISAAACSQPGAPAEQTQQQQIQEISMSDFSDLVKKDPSVHVLDVRTPEEYSEGHVPGAKLFTLQDIESQGASVEQSLPFKKEDKIFVICRSGGRSLKATTILSSLGYSNAVNVQGGTMGYIRMGGKVDK